MRRTAKPRPWPRFRRAHVGRRDRLAGIPCPHRPPWSSIVPARRPLFGSLAAPPVGAVGETRRPFRVPTYRQTQIRTAPIRGRWERAEAGRARETENGDGKNAKARGRPGREAVSGRSAGFRGSGTGVLATPPSASRTRPAATSSSPAAASRGWASTPTTRSTTSTSLASPAPPSACRPPPAPTSQRGSCRPAATPSHEPSLSPSRR